MEHITLKDIKHLSNCSYKFKEINILNERKNIWITKFEVKKFHTGNQYLICVYPIWWDYEPIGELTAKTQEELKEKCDKLIDYYNSLESKEKTIKKGKKIK